MKVSAVIVSRNDNYGGHLIERASYALNSAIKSYDEVIYVDWNSPTHSLLYDVKDNLDLQGNLKHIVIPPDVASQLTNYEPEAQVCCEVLGRNIGIRRAIGDWIVSTNIDIIAPKREDIIKLTQNLDPKIFYTLSRRHVERPDIEKWNYKDIESVRDYLYETSEPNGTLEKTYEGDNYSIINCCGDFQIATKEIWNEIKGFEEELIYPLYADTNVQKKSVMHGFGLRAIVEPPMFHINHGSKGWGGGGFAEGINKKANDPYRAIASQKTTQNDPTWGFSDIEIEFEVF